MGDDNQAIFNSQAAFADIASLFAAEKPAYYTLTKSYRTTGNITRLFAWLVADQNLEILPVRPGGNPVGYHAFQGMAEFKEILQAFQKAVGADQQVTILTKTPVEANQLAEVIQGVNSEIYPVALAKGLEFTNVLLYDVSESNYHSSRDYRLLYTAISRSTTELWLTYQSALPAGLIEK